MTARTASASLKWRDVTGGVRWASCIVLGRGADETKVVGWLETAASVPGFIGFAVGRTTFWNAVADYEAHRMTRQEAAGCVARRYSEVELQYSKRARPSVKANEEICVALHPDDQRRLSRVASDGALRCRRR